jgi:hypothetical protein
MITAIKRLKNVSAEEIEVHHADGCRTSLPSGAVIENVRITNVADLLAVAEITRDLAEVGDFSHVRDIRRRLNS